MVVTKHKLAVVLISLGLLGGGVVAADVGASPIGASSISYAAAQATPASPDAQCNDEQNESGGADATEADTDKIQDENGTDNSTPADTDNVQDENGTDDASEGDTKDGDSEDSDQEADVNGTETQEGEDSEQESVNATPGTLTEGQDLLPQAKITTDEAVAIAEGEAKGDLGSVELEDRDGTLVFEVTVGDQGVFVDAQAGTVVSVERVQNTETDCENEAEGAPGTLVEGQDLLPQATITLDESIATAQGEATGDLGTVELKQDGDTLAFVVEIGDQEVTVDAATGKVLSVDQND